MLLFSFPCCSRWLATWVKTISFYQAKYKDENQTIYEAYLSGAYTLKEIGGYYGKHYTTISRIVKSFEM